MSTATMHSAQHCQHGLEPVLAVCQVVISGVRRQLLLQSGDDLPCMGTGARPSAGDEDHALIAWAAGRDRLVVQGSHIDKVVGDDHSTLTAGEVNDTTVVK